jgi:dTDP-4-dehydrorhamnose 3,5-epimerase
MHWQAEPLPEIKLVRCLAGRVLDVIVDVRPNSPTFGKWHAEELSAENMRALYIPAGFAHGFQCLEDTCELFYLMSEFYQPDLARGLRCDEPQVGIAWPLSILNLSPRDASLPLLSEAVVPTPA